MSLKSRSLPTDRPEPGAEAASRRTREILEGLGDAFVSLDDGWRITDCNAAAEDILEHPRRELLGRTIWEISGISMDSSIADVARRVKRTGQPEEAEITLNVNGRRRLLSLRGIPLADGLAAVARDISELRAAEQRLAENEARFRALANGTPAATWMYDVEGALEYVNPAMAEALGHSPGEVLGDAWEQFVHPDDVQPLRRARNDARATPSRFAFSPRFRRGDGVWRTIELTGRPRFDSEGAFQGHVGTATDVTDTLAAQQRQEMLINELNHRVKNTLATVQSLVRQTLRESPVARDTQKLLTDRLMALSAAHDVLTRGRWEGAELSEMAREAVRPFDNERRRIAIAGPEVRLAPGVALALFLALNELATNALRHGALSAPSGRVSLSWTGGDGAVELLWRETGGPPVRRPRRSGFGSRLLGPALAAQLGAPAELTFAPEGLTCRIRAPVAA